MIDTDHLKIAVLKTALGIKSLEDRELFERLEELWISAYIAGCLDERDRSAAKESPL